MNRAQLRSFAKDQSGFTLIELLIVVTIISIIAALAQPQLQRVLLKARATEVVGDFNAVKVAVAQYQADLSAWPAETSAGTLPTGLDAYLPDGFSFTADEYTLDFDNQGGTPFTVAISLVTTNSDLGLQVMDLLGSSVLNVGTKYTWIIE